MGSRSGFSSWGTAWEWICEMECEKIRKAPLPALIRGTFSLMIFKRLSRNASLFFTRMSINTRAAKLRTGLRTGKG